MARPVKALMMTALTPTRSKRMAPGRPSGLIRLSQLLQAFRYGTPMVLLATPRPVPAWVPDVNSITLKWLAPADGGADITSYQIEVRADDGQANSFTMTDPNDGDATIDRPGNTPISNLPASRTEYTHGGLKAETGYYYRIRALNDADEDGRPGEEGEVSDWTGASATVTTLAATLGTHQAPTAPNATDVTGIGTINISWTAPTVPGGETRSPVTSYEIQWQQSDAATDDEAGWADAETVTPTPPTNTTYSHTSLPGLKRYAYRVRALNSSGPSPWSTTADATTDARDPGTPMLEATSVGATEILLEWNVPDGNGTDLTGFEIQQWDPDEGTSGGWGDTNLLGADNNDGDNLSDEPERTLYTVSNLDAGETYYYRVRAVWDGQADDAGWSATTTSDAASASTVSGVPGAPTLEAASGDDVGSIELTITAPTSGGTDLTAYELQRYENGAWKVITAPATDDESYTDDGLTPGVKYYYSLTASNSSGTGAPSAVVNAVATAGNPDAITTLAATATSETTIRLTWTVPANNGTTITGYRLVKWTGDADSGEWSTTNLLEDDDTVTEFIDTGLGAGTTHYYRIRAWPQVDSDGDTDVIDEGWGAAEDRDDGSSATTHADVPEAVTIAAPSATANSITITWGALAAEDTGGSAISGYNVYKWDGSSWVLKTSLGVVLTYTETGLAAGTKHYYIVRAVNDQGIGQWSNYVSDTTDPATPDAPAMTATARDTTSIQLTWTVPNLNGTASHTGYILQRWNGTVFATIQVDDQDLVLDDTTTLHVDTGLESGTQYWYQILTDAANNSVPSAVVNATTVAAPPERVVLTRPIPDADITHNTIKLTWTAPDHNGSAIIHYEVEVWDTSGSTSKWTRLALIAAQHTTYTHRNLSAETRYVYRVRAQNRAPGTAGGFGSYSTVLAATTDAAPE